MFVPFRRRQLVLAIVLGHGLLPSITRADVLIQKPFNSYTSSPASLSVVNALEISNSAIPFGPSGPPPIDTYNSAVIAAAPFVDYFGTLDLRNNDLIIHPAVQDEAHAYATFKATYDAVRSGADHGGYDMTGITSATVEADAGTTGAFNAKGGLALGVLLNDDGSASHADGSGNPIWGNPNDPVSPADNGTFDGYGAGPGQHLTQYDTIVKYTFIGDLFLEGFVTQTDWAVTFANLGAHPDNSSALNQAWQNGDAFYQTPFGALIDQGTWALTFANLSLQNQYPYTATFAETSDGSNSVPEPASLVMALLGAVATSLATASKAHSKSPARRWQ